MPKFNDLDLKDWKNCDVESEYIFVFKKENI